MVLPILFFSSLFLAFFPLCGPFEKKKKQRREHTQDVHGIQKKKSLFFFMHCWQIYVAPADDMSGSVCSVWHYVVFAESFFLNLCLLVIVVALLFFPHFLFFSFCLSSLQNWCVLSASFAFAKQCLGKKRGKKREKKEMNMCGVSWADALFARSIGRKKVHDKR